MFKLLEPAPAVVEVTFVDGTVQEFPGQDVAPELRASDRVAAIRWLDGEGIPLMREVCVQNLPDDLSEDERRAFLEDFLGEVGLVPGLRSAQRRRHPVPMAFFEGAAG